MLAWKAIALIGWLYDRHHAHPRREARHHFPYDQVLCLMFACYRQMGCPVAAQGCGAIKISPPTALIAQRMGLRFIFQWQYIIRLVSLRETNGVPRWCMTGPSCPSEAEKSAPPL